MARILVTGGAGYIGSHACKALAQHGHEPVSYDNLSSGWKDAVQFGPLEVGDIRDRDRLDAVIAKWQPEAVLHFAALIEVGVSVREPDRFWSVNAEGTLRLLDAMVAAGTPKLIYSSTCAVHGNQDGILLDETSAFAPASPYAETKLSVEMMVQGYARQFGFKHLGFRYFNVAGADADRNIGEFHRPETHLIPLILDAASGRRETISVFGDDYPTPDGTCIRDYVHVSDLIDAHIAGLTYIDQKESAPVITLGTGHGFSVKDVLAAASEVVGTAIPSEITGRRSGDPASLVSGSKLAQDALNWRPHRSTLKTMINDAWGWHQKPGYTA